MKTSNMAKSPIPVAHKNEWIRINPFKCLGFNQVVFKVNFIFDVTFLFLRLLYTKCGYLHTG